MRALECGLLCIETIVVLFIELLVLDNLFFQLSKRGLQGWFLEGLGFLILVDLAREKKVLKRGARIFGNDRVDFLSSILAAM